MAPSFLIGITVVHLSQLRNPIDALLLTPEFIRISLVFLLVFFPCPRKLHYIESSCLLSLLWSVAVYVSLLLMTWTVLRSTDQYFADCLSIRLSGIFHMLRRGSWVFGKEDQRRKLPHHIVSRVHAYQSITINCQVAFACFQHLSPACPTTPTIFFESESLRAVHPGGGSTEALLQPLTCP